VLPEADPDAVLFGLFDRDQVGDAADGQQVAGEGAGQGQRIPFGRLAGVQEFDQQHHGRHVADHVAERGGDAGQQEQIVTRNRTTLSARLKLSGIQGMAGSVPEASLKNKPALQNFC
jgi:hypothetical protein